jgi:hypothetical protein
MGSWPKARTSASPEPALDDIREDRAIMVTIQGQARHLGPAQIWAQMKRQYSST